MGLLYYFETTVDFPGAVEQKEFLKLWLASAEALTKSALGTEDGIRQLWKIPGERKMIGVLNVSSPGVLDTCFASMPMQQTMGHKISTVFTPVRQYEDFAADVGDRIGEDMDSTVVECAPKAGLHYFLTFQVEYGGITQDELFRVWAQEAKAALGAKKSGTVLDLWKVVAERKVLAIICVDDPGELDQMSLDLPIMKTMGDKVQVTCKSIRHVTDWIKDLKEMTQ